MNRRILVTGGAGFIGSHLVDFLLKENEWEVAVVDNFDDFYSPEIKKANLKSHFSDPKFSLYEADIRSNLSSVFESFRPDIIVHLAALAGVRPSLLRPREYAEVNVAGTLNLLEMAKVYGVKKFIFGSSSSVYGEKCRVPFCEDDKAAYPISPYAATKLAGEHLCHTYSHLYGIQVVCLRFFTVYGARQRPDLAIHKFSKLIWEEKPIPVFGDGTTKRDYTYIDDIIQGLRRSIDYEESNYEIFNLGESRTVELGYLIELLEKNLGKKAIIEKKPMQPGDVSITFADISKAKMLLGYNPQTKIEDGIKKFAEWFKLQYF
ncbi:MAG: GDP-mannose 4,6-dehydratase [Pyrinomonadaceae bacterium]|nr:GDP-mannose 4,6-dehydratase [Pyrinomonadaceae bacterium]MCX7640115.1 GDP-mannose 4,6-dehydratase [Pyrinomonadaceae bacterium]MDW8303297.1 GDP-mannose 4,6-dehydratase [Acidobacteriota bacterium]